MVVTHAPERDGGPGQILGEGLGQSTPESTDPPDLLPKILRVSRSC